MAEEKTKAAVSKKPAKARLETPAANTIRIQYYRSSISTPKKHKVIVRSVGFTKLNQIVERPDTPSMRGYVEKVPHLLRIVE
jgi:large subunit ribosomal protein L30